MAIEYFYYSSNDEESTLLQKKVQRKVQRKVIKKCHLNNISSVII